MDGVCQKLRKYRRLYRPTHLVTLQGTINQKLKEMTKLKEIEIQIMASTGCCLTSYRIYLYLINELATSSINVVLVLINNVINRGMIINLTNKTNTWLVLTKYVKFNDSKSTFTFNINSKQFQITTRQSLQEEH